MLKYEYDIEKKENLLKFWEANNLKELDKKINSIELYFYYYYKLNSSIYNLIKKIYTEKKVKHKDLGEDNHLVNYLDDINFINHFSDRSRLIKAFDYVELSETMNNFIDKFKSKSINKNNYFIYKCAAAGIKTNNKIKNFIDIF